MTNETNIKNEVEVTITIDSIDFGEDQEKRIHIQNATKLKKYIDANEIYFDFFNQEIYRYFEETDESFKWGAINGGNQIRLTFKLRDISRQLQQALKSNQEIFFDFFNHNAWMFNEDGDDELLGGFSDFQLIDVVQIKQD